MVLVSPGFLSDFGFLDLKSIVESKYKTTIAKVIQYNNNILFGIPISY